MPSKQFVNRKARHEYEIVDKWEAGIALQGSEVKSIREGGVSFTGSFAHIKEGEAYLHNLHIAPYSAIGYPAGDPKRERKLLLHKREIQSLTGTLNQKGLTLIPLRIYFKQGIAKVEIGLARGRKLYDKRRKLKERDTRREIERTLKERDPK
jgi:SsrA-binding protein